MAIMSTRWLGLNLLVLGLALILKCQGMPLFMASSQYDINTGKISYTSNNTGTISYTSNNTGTIQGNTSNNTCPPCKKGEKLLTNATATPHPCLCSKCSPGQYTDIDDSCVQCDCCNKTNKITGENMWGHIMKECEALFQYHKCDRDVDFRVEECPAEPPYFPPPPTPTHPGPQPTTPPPPTVEFPWKYTVIIGVAAVLIVPFGIMGTIFLYKRRKRSNEERLLHKAVKETGGEEGGYSNEGLQDAAGDSSERTQDVAGDSNERETNISLSVNKSESVTLSGALTCESEQAANSLHDGPSADDTSIEDSMTDVPSKSKQDKGDDQVRVHENNVCEDADAAAKADPWSEEDELLYEDQQQRSESVSSLPQQHSGGDSFISVNPSGRPSEESGDGTYAKVGANTTFDHSDFTQTTGEEEGDDNGATHCKSLAGDEATEQTVTRDESITKPGEQEAVSVVKGGQQVTTMDMETDSATEQDLPDSGTGVDCGMAAAPRPADGEADEEEQEPQNKETNPQTGSRDEEEENELNMVTPSSTSSGDQAQQDMKQEIVQDLPTTATAKEAVEGFPGAKRGLTTKPQPCITTDSRSETTNQMSGQASGGTVRVHHSDALSRPQVKANEHDRQMQVEHNCMEDLSAVGTGGSTGTLTIDDTVGSTGNLATGGTGNSLRNPAAARNGDAKVSDQDIVPNDQRPGEEEEAGGEDQYATGGVHQVQDDNRVRTDDQRKTSHGKSSEEEESL